MTDDSDQKSNGSPRALLRDVMHGLIHDHSFHYAAGTAFRTMLAVFPLLLGIISLASLLGSGDRIHEVLDTLGRTDAVPGRTVQALQSQLDDLDEPGPNQVVGAIAAFSLAIWSAAAAFRTIMSGLNRALSLDEHRGLVHRFFVSLGLAGLTASLAIAATLLVAEGPAAEDIVHSLPGSAGPLEVFWEVARWPVVVLLVFSWLATTYTLAPADRRPFKLVSPGIVFAFLLWLAFALLFSAYVDASGNQQDTYGAFAGLVAFQLYVYWSALIVLLGAQVDCVLGRRGGDADD